MFKRIVSTIVLWIGIITIISIFGAEGTVWIAAVAAAFTQWELYQMFSRMGHQSYPKTGVTFGLFIVLGAYYLPGLLAGTDVFVLAFVILCLTIEARSMFRGQLGSFLPTLFGLVYVPYMLQYFVVMIQLVDEQGLPESTGIFFCVWILASAKFTDVGGLLLGKKFGRTKLAPHISPGKTWEGVIGGIVVSGLVSMLLVGTNKWLAHEELWYIQLPERFTVLLAGLLTLPIAFVSVFSDLIESGFKRSARMKDSGNAIPGIGGVFDLTDSVILCAPVGYMLIKYFVLTPVSG